MKVGVPWKTIFDFQYPNDLSVEAIISKLQSKSSIAFENTSPGLVCIRTQFPSSLTEAARVFIHVWPATHKRKERPSIRREGRQAELVVWSDFYSSPLFSHELETVGWLKPSSDWLSRVMAWTCFHRKCPEYRQPVWMGSENFAMIEDGVNGAKTSFVLVSINKIEIITVHTIFRAQR